jgi:glucosamine-phosphate N-acetyltransferase
LILLANFFSSLLVIFSFIFESNLFFSPTDSFEPKIIRNGKSVGHIEDIVVDEKCRSMGISKRIIEKLFSFANEHNCYKVILDCNPRLSDFYEKLGFEKHGIQMSKYF